MTHKQLSVRNETISRKGFVMISQIKHWIEVENLSISEISRRTKKSRRTIGRIIKKNNITLKSSWNKEYPAQMTQLQEEILRGTILGDDCLYRFPTCKHPTLMIYHSLSEKEYIDFKYRTWNQFTGFKEPKKIKRNSGHRLYFNTGANKCFEQIYNQVYIENGKKRITQSFLDSLTITSVAFWFMDDGSRCKNKGLAIHTNCFKLEEVEMASCWFKAKYDIKCWPQKRKENQWVIFFSNQTSEQFAEMILPKTHPSMRYKLKGIYTKNPQRLYAIPFDIQTEDIV